MLERRHFAGRSPAAPARGRPSTRKSRPKAAGSRERCTSAGCDQSALLWLAQRLPLLADVRLALHLAVVPVRDGLPHLHGNIGRMLRASRGKKLFHGSILTSNGTPPSLSAGLIGLLLAWLVLARLLVLGVVLLLLSRVLLVRVLLLRVVLLLLLVVLLSHGYLLHMVVKEARQTKRPTAAQICTALVTSVGPDMRLSRRTGQSVRSPMLRHRR